MQTVTKDTEAKLAELVGTLTAEAQNWRAVYFRFDQLLEQYRSEYQIQIAVNLLNDLLFANAGGVYVCTDKTLVLLCRSVSRGQLEKAIFQLRYLFMDDPLAYDTSGDENPEFCKMYDLGIEYAEFSQFCRRKLSQLSRPETPETLITRGVTPESVSVDPAKNFTPTRLAHVEHDLNKADLTRVLRRQPICAVTGESDIRRVFDEYYIHIAHLRQMLRTEADFFSNRWLFRYLTHLLDARMLDLLTMTPLRYFETPVSLNFNIETLLSRKFRDFDAVVKPAVKSSIVIEVQIGEVFGDIAAFFTARNLLQRWGYKLCIDGVTNLNILHIDRERLGFDLVKLQWNADGEIDNSSEDSRALARAVKNCGQNRIILSRCDSKQAISYGQELGINLFQGRYLDRIINPHQKVDN